MKSLYSSRRSAGKVLGLGLALVLAAGCGGSFTAPVSGKVTYKGKALPGGTVTFIHPDGRVGYGTIHEDGTYSISAAPGGNVKCIVQTTKPIVPPPQKLAARLSGGAAKPGATVYPAGPYVPIPEKYGDPQTSGLSYTIDRASNTIDIPLE
jgi:hypothetical protein